MNLLEFLAARLKEPSSYAGIGTLLAALGISPGDTTLAAIIQLCVAVAGMVAVLIPEQSAAAKPTGSVTLPPAAVVLLVAATLALGACQSAGSAAAIAGGAISAADGVQQLITAEDRIIVAACADYANGKTTANAAVAAGRAPAGMLAKLVSIEGFGDAACANPPQGDPLSTAIWLGELAGDMKTLVAGGSGANPS